MSDIREYQVEVVAANRRSGDTRRVRARSLENAIKRVRKEIGAEWQDGTYTAKEIPA